MEFPLRRKIIRVRDGFGHRHFSMELFSTWARNIIVKSIFFFFINIIIL